MRLTMTVLKSKLSFISQSGDFIKTQEFTQTPSQDERLMTNETIDWDKKIAPSAIYEEGAVVFQFFMDLWEKTVQSKVS